MLPTLGAVTGEHHVEAMLRKKYHEYHFLCLSLDIWKYKKNWYNISAIQALTCDALQRYFRERREKDPREIIANVAPLVLSMVNVEIV